jgi:putative ABC transport system permease protein
VKRFLNRLQRLLRSRQLESDLADEMECHRAMVQERLERSGMPAHNAAAASRRTLGNLALAREDARAVWIGPWLDSVRQDVSYALRSLARNPGFGAALVLVTALGIGAATTVFGLVNRLVLAPLPVQAPARLVYFEKPSFSYPVFQQVRAAGAEVFSTVLAWNLESVHVDWNGELEPAEVLMASGDFHRALGLTAAAGRLLAPDDDRIGGGADGLVAVISFAAWERRFQRDPAAIGRTVRIDRQPYTIVGVAPRGFFGVAPGLAPEITIPLTATQSPDALASTSSDWVHLLARLRDGVTFDQGQAAVAGFWPQVLAATLGPAMPDDRRARYLSRTTALASAAAGYSRVRNAFADPLWLLFYLVALLFAVGCASAANLLLARSVTRRKELAIRLSIGASRGRVIRQVLTESFVWTVIGAAAGVLFASWAGDILVAMLRTREEPIAIDVSPDWRVAVFALGLTLLTVAICAVVPAVRAANADTREPLQAQPTLRGSMLRRWSLGKALVAAQVALTMLLLVGGALFVRSLARVLSQDAGLDRGSVLVVAADAEAAGFSDERLTRFNTDLQERLARIPGVESVSLSMMPPISDDQGSWTQPVATDGAAIGPESREAYFNAVSPAFFRTVGIRILSGRDFTAADTSGGPRVAAINRTLAARLFPGPDVNDAIGHRLTMGKGARRQDIEIVAIVADAKYQRLQENARGIVFLPIAQQGMDANLYAEVRVSGRVAAIAAAVTAEVRAIDRAVPVQIDTIAARINASLVKERVMALLASTLGIAALVLACAALYGLLAYAVSRQAKEIGLRLALGASRRAVVWMVMRDCLVVTAAGTIAGLGAALAFGRFARTLLFQVSATDAISLAAAAGVMAVVALLAGLVPSMRAAQVDPAASLKAE